MRSRRLATVVAAALVVGLGATACDEDDWPVQGEWAPGIKAVLVNQAVMQYMEDKDIAGATVAATRAGRLVWSTSYGWADEATQTRMKPWHRSRIGSTSKVITAIGLLQLLEAQGNGDLGDLTTTPVDLQSQLERRLYGHPGADWTSPDWPTVTEPTVLANPEVYWEAIRTGVQSAFPQTYEAEMATMIEWASQVEVRHLLSHTANYVAGGDVEDAAEYFGVGTTELTYSQVHQFLLSGQLSGDEGNGNVKCWLDGQFYVDTEDPAYTGQDYVLPPLLNPPGAKRCYSNHDFGMAGMVIDELAGAADYREFIEQNILDPLGLTEVAPNDIETGELDAFPHGSYFGAADTTGLGWAAGGWSATAQDLARVMCGLDRDSNNLRLLSPETVTVMETVIFPETSSTQPLGWDKRGGLSLTKNGAVGGGGSRITKYLPGSYGIDDEINVAVMFNDDVGSPPESLLNTIAAQIAAADIPEDYDLFEPEYACVVPPAPFEPGVIAPRPTLTATEGPDIVAPTGTASPTRTPGGPATGTPTRTDSTPPGKVVIRHPAPGERLTLGEPLRFEAVAVDGHGKPIPGTSLRWTAQQGSTRVELCVGSDLGKPVTPPGAEKPVADCATFTAILGRPLGAGKPVTIRVEAFDGAVPSGEHEVEYDLLAGR